MNRRRMMAGALAMALCGALPAGAQPSRAPLGHGIVDSGSERYEVQQFTLPGPGGAGDTAYLVSVLVPRGAPPAAGFPVLYALDGKAVVERLTDDVLGAATGDVAGAPVIVAIGYDTEARFAGAERSRDYTPPLEGVTEQRDARGRPAGGFAPFYDRVVTEILPRAEGLAPVDPARRWLWGHSYGGLFVLQAAMQEDPQPFSRFVAASPSLWWDEGRYLARLRAALRAGARPGGRLDMQHGSAERRRGGGPSRGTPGHDSTGHDGARHDSTGRGSDAVAPAGAPSGGAAGNAGAEGAFDALAQGFRDAGVEGDFTTFPGLSHGQTFGRSLQDTLAAISAERDD